MAGLITTLGIVEEEDAGLILPHEHIFVDLGPIELASYQSTRAEEVIPVMAPELEKLRQAGGSVLVECTPLGVGRRVDIVKAVSQAANFPVVVPTGIYREPWVPAWAQNAPVEKIRDWMLSELEGEIEASAVRAAWIKLSAGDDGLTTVESKILRAAAQAGKQSGAVIGSHTIKGRVVREQLDIIEQEGYTPERFIWIHTQAEPDPGIHLEIARRGAWVEFDGIGWEDDDPYLERIQRVLEAGLEDHMLLSQDRGWYDPSKPGGGVVKSFTYLSEVFLPKLRTAGVADSMIHKLTHTNPFRAFAR
jgi:phosphotriesterase-related protein